MGDDAVADARELQEVERVQLEVAHPGVAVGLGAAATAKAHVDLMSGDVSGFGKVTIVHRLQG